MGFEARTSASLPPAPRLTEPQGVPSQQRKQQNSWVGLTLAPWRLQYRPLPTSPVILPQTARSPRDGFPREQIPKHEPRRCKHLI